MYQIDTLIVVSVTSSSAGLVASIFASRGVFAQTAIRKLEQMNASEDDSTCCIYNMLRLSTVG